MLEWVIDTLLSLRHCCPSFGSNGYEAMTRASSSDASGRVVRPRFIWRLLFALVTLLGAFLYVSLISLGGYLLMLGFDAEHPQPQRMMALAGGGGILLVGLWLLKVALPRRVSPVLVDRDR